MAANSSKYVFLVDDEPIQNEMLKDYLSERFDYKFKTYDNGEDAVKDLHMNPEFIVLDYHLNAHLPNAQNGVEVLIKMREKSPEARVIMLSGQDKIEVAVDSMKYGAVDYVIKGETAFARMENIITNMNVLRNMKASNKVYRMLLVLMLVMMLLIVAFSYYMVNTHSVNM